MRAARWAMAVIAAAALMPGAAAASPPPPKVLTSADSGSTVTVARGQRLRIELSVCYGCGYHWETRRAPSRRVLRRLPQRQSGGTCQQQPGCVGGGSVTIFRYAGRAEGITRLRLGYIPPGSDTPEETFRLRVRVR